MNHLERVHRLLGERELDAVVIMEANCLRYFSDFTGGEGTLVVGKDYHILYTDSRYVESASYEAKCFEVRDIGGKKYSECIAEIFKEKEVHKAGFEGNTILLRDYRRMTEAVPEVLWEDISSDIEKIRMIKESVEIVNIERAEAIGDLAFNRILNFIKPGVTEKEIAMELERIMKENGASGLSFETIVASGTNSSMPHANVTDKEVEYGDFIIMDFGCKFEGYCSDMTRTVVVGKANEEQRKIYQTVLDAQKAALEVIKEGMVCSEVDKVARDLIANAGFGECFGHALGHSVGLEIHEVPTLSRRCSEVLKENMLMTVEPGIYLPGFGGVRIEDLVLVTKDGYRNLTYSRKDLVEL